MSEYELTRSLTLSKGMQSASYLVNVLKILEEIYFHSCKRNLMLYVLHKCQFLKRMVSA